MTRKSIITILWSLFGICFLIIMARGANDQPIQEDLLTKSQTIIIPSIDDVKANGYPTNEMGQTYGPDIKEDTDPEAVPDLILVCNKFGVEGYIKQTDIRPGASTLEEAMDWIPREYTINMYLQDGCTIIGTFTVDR